MPDVPAARRDVMSRLIATFIFRWRYPLSALCVLGALVSIPSANITKIDNDITAWFSKIGSRLPGLRALSRRNSAAPAT